MKISLTICYSRYVLLIEFGEISFIMPKYTKKSNPLLFHQTTRSSWLCSRLDRPARNAMPTKPTKPPTDEIGSADDGVSTCSNVSDATSIYDDVECKTISIFIRFDCSAVCQCLATVPSASEVILSTESLDEKLDTSIEELRNKE